jgi:uncharacterized small protein (DUF1192 family)
MSVDAKEIDNLERGQDLLETRKIELNKRIEILTKEIDVIKASAANKEEERDAVYYDENKFKYEVDLRDLVVVGSVTSTHTIGDLFQFSIRNLQKKDSLAIDQNVKNYSKEANVYAENKIRFDILTKALVSFGLPGKMVRVPENFEEAQAALGSINEDCLQIIWNEYAEFNRWVQCALRVQLKNSLRLQKSGSR